MFIDVNQKFKLTLRKGVKRPDRNVLGVIKMIQYGFITFVRAGQCYHFKPDSLLAKSGIKKKILLASIMAVIISGHVL
jgi:hypothetical protein